MTRLVFLHALPLDSRQWDDQLDLLPRIAPFAPTLYQLGKTLTEWAAAILDATSNDPLFVVGNSIGGSCALEMARQAPDRIAAMVLIGTKPAHRPEPEFRERFIAALEAQPDQTIRQWINDLLGPGASAELRHRLIAMALKQKLADLINGVRVFHSRPDASDVVAKWRKPLLFIRGEHDRVATLFRTTDPAPVTDGNGGMIGSANHQHQTLGGCGHYTNLEQPVAVRKLLVDMFNRLHPTA